ncbi:hypothetical protein ACKLNR_008836 [Fusarium oxysporum f. sp. zingiberi]
MPDISFADHSLLPSLSRQSSHQSSLAKYDLQQASFLQPTSTGPLRHHRQPRASMFLGVGLAWVLSPAWHSDDDLELTNRRTPGPYHEPRSEAGLVFCMVAAVNLEQRTVDEEYRVLASCMSQSDMTRGNL